MINHYSGLGSEMDPQPAQLPAHPLMPGEAARLLARRMHAGRQAAAARGNVTGGVVPYGYRRSFDPATGRPVWRADPETAPVVRRIFREYLRVRSLAKVAEALSAEGIPSANGRTWSRAALAFIVKNEAYRGMVRYGSIRARGAHPPLVAPIVFNRARQLARENRRRPPASK
ncbi:MAG: recombinase family protein [Planctomycetes bacterium]|nr:recombinase family protein [Planctomycetota bacterium]